MQYNSPTSTSHASTGIEIPSFAAEQNESTEHQINKWRQHIEQSDHAMVVFDSNCKPMELNHVLRECLSDATVSRESVQSNATVWRVICETVTNYVQEAVAAGDSSISDVYPVSNMCVAVVGWALRNSKGDFMGAVVKIANLSDQSHRLEKLFDDSESAKSVTCKSNLMTEDEADLFQTWIGNRDQARRKMKLLSRRETQVVSLVAEGLPNKTIARELDLSTKTIEKHRASAVKKLGVNSSCEMVRIAVIAGNKSPIVSHPPVDSAASNLCPT